MKGKKGIITVEAAMALPIFLTAFLAIAYLMNVLYVHYAVGAALRNTCREIASCAYPISRLSGEVIPDELMQVGGDIMTILYAGADVTSALSEDDVVDKLVLQNGSFHMLQSSFLRDGETIDLVAQYRIELPFLDGRLKSPWFIQRARMQAWVGFHTGETEDGGEEEEDIVYITPHGSVYHRDADCTYLRPVVHAVGASDISGKRSRDGSIYYACEYCHPNAEAGGSFYVTSYGNRYHSDRQCRGIWHEVEAVPISEAGGRLPCSKCGR